MWSVSSWIRLCARAVNSKLRRLIPPPSYMIVNARDVLKGAVEDIKTTAVLSRHWRQKSTMGIRSPKSHQFKSLYEEAQKHAVYKRFKDVTNKTKN